MSTRPEPVDVAIYADGTYPYRIGGVSSVIHGIIDSLPDVRFGVMYLHWEAVPSAPVYERPQNVAWTLPVRVADFTSATRTLRGVVYPQARVHHAHTCGLAGLAAVTAKDQQRQSRMILSEHSLFVRDMISRLDALASPQNKHAWMERPGANELPPLPDDGNGQLRASIIHTAQYVYENADTVTYLHPGLANDAMNFGLRRERSIIIPNTINVADFQHIAPRSDTPGQWHIAIIGRIVPVKGIIEGIKCARHLREAGIDFRMSIIGPDDEAPCYAKWCRELVTGNDLENTVTFRPAQPVTQALAHTDLLLLPSHSEAMPMIVLEAMAAGVPVVASHVGNVASILGNGASCEAGIVLENQTGPDPAAMARAIIELEKTRERHRSMRINGPVRAARFHDTRLSTPRWRQVYSI